MLVCGVDEAGRGPVFGPMVIGCVVLDDAGREELRRLNVKDSKKLSAERRGDLEPEIKKAAVEWSLARISASEIDRMRMRMSLNDVEATKIADLICALTKRPGRVIVDAADPVADNFRKRIDRFLSEKNRLIPEILSEHRADDRYIEVSAASVLAKVARDREIEELRRLHGDIGSGYPSDEVTQRFLRKLSAEGELPDYVRRSWSTVGRSSQTTLGEY